MHNLREDVDAADITAIGDQLKAVLKSYLSANEWAWFTSVTGQIAADPQPGLVARAFTSLPRQIESERRGLSVSLDDDSLPAINGSCLLVFNWPLVRLARVCLLMAIPRIAQEDYLKLIERLFKYGEMEELAALYAALPVYHYPKAWISRCQEGVRSNIGLVRQAVIVRNPYPCRFLNEDAWNQLVLKAFFVQEDLMHIVGLSQRNNPNLAHALTDYAYERHAAGREINPMLWILTGPYIDARAYNLMERVIETSKKLLEQQAIAYAFKHSSYDQAHGYLAKNERFNALSDPGGTPWEAWRQQ